MTDETSPVDDDTDLVDIRILDRNYSVLCAASERDTLEAAAQRLNQQLIDARSSGRIIDSERMAMMVALNLAFDAVELERLHGTLQTRINDQLKRLERRLGSRQPIDTPHQQPAATDSDPTAGASGLPHGS